MAARRMRTRPAPLAMAALVAVLLVGWIGCVAWATITVTCPSNPSPVNEGTQLAGLEGTFTDDNGLANAWTGTVDWGDGTQEPIPGDLSTKTFALPNHTYADDGSYSFEIEIANNQTESSTCGYTITVNDLGPTAALIGDTPRNEGQEGSYDASGATSSPDAIASYAWDWDYDGATFTPSGDDSASETHTWADNGEYDVAVRVTDDDGSTDIATLTVTVTNVNPSVTIDGEPVDGPEGTEIPLTCTVDDPGTADTFTYAWAVTKDGNPFGTGTAAGFAFTPDDNGSYVVTLTVTDDDLGAGSADPVTITVTNVAPTIALTDSPDPVDEGTTYTLTLGAITDPGDDTVTDWIVDWGDGNSDTYDSAGAKTHEFADDGSYDIAVDLTDEDGTHVDAGAESVTVSKVAPTVDALLGDTILEGGTYTEAGSFTDPGDDAWTATVDYGDGSGVHPLTLTGKDFTLTHTYADDGPYTVTVVVTDTDDTLSGNETCTITVDNVAPTIALTDSPDPVDEGMTYTLTLGAITDPGDDTVTSWIVDWGDGNTNTYDSAGAKTHEFADDGSYDIAVDLTDEDGTHADAGAESVTVSKVAPTVDALSGDTILEGGTYTEAGSFTDPGDDAWTATVDYGDGSGVQALALTGKDFDLSHTYADDGSYTVTVEVTDTDDALSDTETCTVTVNNADPVVTAPANTGGAEGAVITPAAASFADAGAADTHTATVDWGDGQTEDLGAVTSPIDLGSHTYADDSALEPGETYTVTVTVSDDDEGVGTDTFEITVSNVAPTIVLSDSPDPVDEGSTYTLTLGAITDPGDDTVTDWIVDWGDGNTNTYTETGAKTHVYADDGDYDIAVDLTDEDGTHVDAGAESVVVDPVAPAIAALSGGTVSEGSPFIEAGSFTDPGDDAWTATVDYGDGSGIQPLALAGKDFTLNHTYADNGIYTVTVEVTDTDDALSDTETCTVTVLNVAPALAVASNRHIDEGKTLSITNVGTFTDPAFADGALDNTKSFTYDIDWGDGTAHSTGAATIDAAGSVGTPTSGSFNGSHVYALPYADFVGPSGDYTVTVTITDDDGGATTDTFVVTVHDVGEPNTAFNVTPPNPDHNASASFNWGGKDDHSLSADLVYSTKLDGGTWSAWSAPNTISTVIGPLEEGVHTFSVRAMDEAGNIESTASYTWVVDLYSILPEDGEGSLNEILDKGVAGGAGYAGDTELAAIYEQGETIGISFPLYDNAGEPIVDALVTVWIMQVAFTNDGEEYTVLQMSTIAYDPELGAYALNIETLTEDVELPVGYYDLWIVIGDGTQLKLRIQITEPTGE